MIHQEEQKEMMIRRASFVIVPVLAIVAVLFGIPQLTTAQRSDCAPRFAASWTETDFCNSSIDFSEVFSGGVGRDGIPAVTDPGMESIEDAAQWLGDRAPVIAVEVDGDARAYPQAVLMWHEIANDEIGGVPVAVTFCPLCNSSIVFDRRVEGDTLEFGVSGLLRNSDLVMYDRTTFSWFQQFTGAGIVGDLNGTLLDIIPSQVIGFQQFAERYPDGLVMSRDTGFNRSYGSNPYVGLDDNAHPTTSLFRGEYDDRVERRARVLAGVIDGEAIAYPFPTLFEEVVINDTVGETPVVAFWQPGVASALDERIIDASRDVGTAALFSRELNGETLTFTYDADNSTLIDEQTGSTWNLFGEATAGELEGEALEQLVAAPHFWFAWAAFHPETAVYGLDDES